MPLPRILWVTFKHWFVTPNPWEEKSLFLLFLPRFVAMRDTVSWDRQNITQVPWIWTFPRISKWFHHFGPHFNTRTHPICNCCLVNDYSLEQSFSLCFSLTKIIKQERKIPHKCSPAFPHFQSSLLPQTHVLQAGSGACCTPNQHRSIKADSSRDQLGKKLLNSGGSAKTLEKLQQKKTSSQILTTDRTQQHTANSSTNPATAWLDTDTVSEKAQGVWFCVTNMHRKQNMNQFCYKARVHAEIHSQLRKVGVF